MADTINDRRLPYSYELYAAAPIIKERCVDKNLEYMECKKEHEKEHPKVCLDKARAVQECVYDTYISSLSSFSFLFFNLSFFLSIRLSLLFPLSMLFIFPSYRIKTCKKTCPVEFQKFADCLYNHNTRYEDCRKVQAAFMKCWNDAQQH